MLCEGIEGKSVDEVLASTAEQVMDFAIRDLTINRQRCALTAWKALFQALPGAATNRKSIRLPCDCDATGVQESSRAVDKPP